MLCHYNLDLLATKEHAERLQHKLEEQLKKSKFAATTSALGIYIRLHTIAIMRGNFGLYRFGEFFEGSRLTNHISKLSTS